jgi:hypothetical protein
MVTEPTMCLFYVRLRGLPTGWNGARCPAACSVIFHLWTVHTGITMLMLDTTISMTHMCELIAAEQFQDPETRSCMGHAASATGRSELIVLCGAARWQ